MPLEIHHRWQDAGSGVPGDGPGDVAAPLTAERAVIGDQIRIPVVWCQMGSCIARYTDPAALGEHDVRTRAMAVGWREDAFGRYACPSCQQRDPRFWATRPLVPWNRDVAVARIGLAAAVHEARRIREGGTRRVREERTAPAMGTVSPPRVEAGPGPWPDVTGPLTAQTGGRHRRIP
jgi:hypothetical protein